MLIKNLKELQSYREFQTTASINLVKTAVINNIAPACLTQIQTNIFNEKFLNNEWQIVNIPLYRRANLAHGVNRLVYKPNKGEPVCIWVCKVQSYFIRSALNVVQSTILISDSAQSKHNARI